MICIALQLLYAKSAVMMIYLFIFVEPSLHQKTSSLMRSTRIGMGSRTKGKVLMKDCGKYKTIHMHHTLPLL